MICALEHLPLFGDAVDYRLQRGTTVGGAEGSGLDVGADLLRLSRIAIPLRDDV